MVVEDGVRPDWHYAWRQSRAVEPAGATSGLQKRSRFCFGEGGRPAPTQSHLEESIDGAEPRSAIASGQQFQVMAEREIFKEEIVAQAERGPERGGEGEAEPNRRAV